MVLKFYYDLASAPARAVYFTLKNLNLDVEFVNVSLIDGEHRSETYLKTNPIGTVPCIEDNGSILVDSHAINIYLTTKYPQGEKFYPSDPVKRALVNERLFYEASELFGVLKGTAKKIIFQGGTEVEKDTIDRLESGYNGLEIYLKNGQYIAGDDLTIADFSIVSTVSAAMIFVPLNKDKFPLLNAYLGRAVTWPFYAEINEAGAKKLDSYIKIKNPAFFEKYSNRAN